MNKSRVRGPYARFCERDEADLISCFTLLDLFWGFVFQAVISPDSKAFSGFFGVILRLIL